MGKESSGPLSTPSWGLVLVRIAVGLVVLKAGWGKVSGGVSDELVTGTATAFAGAPGFIRWWGDHVVLPHPTIFSHMIAWGEFLGGLAMFFGALTRPAGLALAFMFANFYFVGPESAQLFVFLLSVCCFGCFLSRAGRSCGMDTILEGRLPRWVTW